MRQMIMSGSNRLLLLLGAATALAATLVPYGHVAAQGSGATGMTLWERKLMETEGMAAAHPDFRWRRAALVEIEAGRQQLAQKYLERAARYADKSSQALIAERYWQGEGVSRDRALAYAWMDLAAERGYVLFAGHREKYWASLDRAERARALSVGQAVYAEYGDEVAKPRLEALLRRGQSRMTGSSAGSRNGVQVYAAPSFNPSGGAGIGKHGTANPIAYIGPLLPNYYAAHLWKPDLYWKWQDTLHAELSVGLVSVGDLRLGEPGAQAADAEDAATTRTEDARK